MNSDTSLTTTELSPFRFEITVPQDVIDENGHVNNVVYVQWMQDVAVRHSESTGGTKAAHDVGCSWVVRSHRVDYLSPAFAEDLIEIETWVVDFRRVRSLRKYKFIRKSDGKILATGETDWVFVAMSNGRPCAVPEEVQKCFPLLPDYK